MVTVHGKQYNEPLGKGLPYYRIEVDKDAVFIQPYCAPEHPGLLEHRVTVDDFYSRNIAQTSIILNSAYHNRLEISARHTGGRRIMFSTFVKEGVDGPGLMYDHMDNDPTNDSSTNLRPVNATQNSYNKKLAKNNKTGYKGIQPTKSGKGTWSAVVTCGGKTYSGRTYSNKIIAALAYNELAKKHHKEYAHLNKVSVADLLKLASDPVTYASVIKDLNKLDACFGTNWSAAIAR